MLFVELDLDYIFCARRDETWLCLCEQQRRRTEYALAQSDHHLYYPLSLNLP